MVLAARPEVIAWLRPVFLGAAGLLLGLAVTTQSRGWLFTLPIVLVATLVLVPGRARLILFAAPMAGALTLISGDLLAPYHAVDLVPAEAGTALGSAFDGATRSLLVATGALVIVGALGVWVDLSLHRWFHPTPAIRRGVTTALLASLALGCVAAGAVATDARPLQRIESAWTNRDRNEGDRSHFAALGSGRYAVWRVGLLAWREHPIDGLGQDNFVQTYITKRKDADEEPRWLHSLPLRLLVHTGLVGFALFALFVIAAAWAAITSWARRAREGPARLAGSLAMLPAVVWLAHGSVDWLWEYPGLSGPALGLTGAAVALGSSALGKDRAAVATKPSRRRIAAACAGALVCAAVVVPSYVADREVQAAAAHWPANPEAAFDRLERARALNPLSARAALVEGVIAVRLGRLRQAHSSFTRAAQREPHDWFARFELGLVEGARRDRAAALRYLLAAQRLNPLDPLVARAVDLARQGRTMSFQAAQEEFELRVRQRISAPIP